MLVVADYTVSPPFRRTWIEFFAERDRLLVEEQNEIKGFILASQKFLNPHPIRGNYSALR